MNTKPPLLFPLDVFAMIGAAAFCFVIRMFGGAAV